MAKKATTPEAYNAGKAGKLWQFSELPLVLREQRKRPFSFTKKVKLLQQVHELEVDGKLGPATLKAIRCVHASGSAPTAPDEAGNEVGQDAPDHHLEIDGGEAATPFPVTRHPSLKSRTRSRGTLINTIIVHQSVSSDLDGTADYLRRKGYGVHLMIDGDGSIHQFGDLMGQMAHANERNSVSIGIELINPYTHTTGAWTEMIDPSPVAWKKRETADTAAQMESLDVLCAFLTSPSHAWAGSRGVRLEVPPDMPLQKPGGPCRGGAAWFDRSVGGIIAHGHRPGKYPASHPKAGQRVKGVHADGRRTVWMLSQRMKP